MKPNSTTLVIARYEEDLEWITEVPEHFRIVIYNKGGLIPSLSALSRADVIIPRDNVGREAETYLHHMIADAEDSSDWTVFCQGDPFPHSPDFLKLLQEQEQWKSIQPLTVGWLKSLNIPPPYLLERETDGNLGDLRVRPETFSLHLWTATHFADMGCLGHREEYARIFDLPKGGNLAAHFFAQAGLSELTEEAEAADCGKFSYGAIFAVHTRLIRRLRPEALHSLLALSTSAGVIPYILERLWLHLFGEPFLELGVARLRRSKHKIRYDAFTANTSGLDSRGKKGPDAIRLVPKIKIHYVINETQKWLRDEFFLPSLPYFFEPIEHICPIENEGGIFACRSYREVMRWKIEKMSESLKADELIIWSDIDIIFNRRLGQSMIEILQDLPDFDRIWFQPERERGLEAEVNIGFFAVVPGEKSRTFFARFRESMSFEESMQVNSQQIANQLLRTTCNGTHSLFDYQDMASASNKGMHRDSLLYHANCTPTLEEKTEPLKAALRLFL